MSFVYINLENVNPKFKGRGSSATIDKTESNNGVMYAKLVNGSSNVDSGLNQIISNPKTKGINIFILNSDSSIILTSSNVNEWLFTRTNANSIGLNGTWLNNGIGSSNDNIETVAEIWKEYFFSLKSAFPNLLIGVSFGGLGLNTQLPKLISNFNIDKGKYLISLLIEYRISDFIEFDIENSWNGLPGFATPFRTFLDNAKKNNDYSNTKIKVGATNPVGASKGSGTGSNGSLYAGSGSPQWIKNYDNLEFVIYTYGVCTSNNLFDNNNPWFPEEKSNSFLPNSKKQIQFSITGYDNNSICPTGGLSKPYSYVKNGIDNDTSSFISKTKQNYGPFNIFWAVSGVNTYKYDNIIHLINNLSDDKPTKPVKINSINIVRNNLNIKYS